MVEDKTLCSGESRPLLNLNVNCLKKLALHPQQVWWETAHLKEAKLVRCLVRADDQCLHIAYVDIATCDSQS